MAHEVSARILKQTNKQKFLTVLNNHLDSRDCKSHHPLKFQSYLQKYPKAGHTDSSPESGQPRENPNC